LFDTAAKLIDVHSNFLLYPIHLLLFQFRTKCNHLNLFVLVITSCKFHRNLFSILAKRKKYIRHWTENMTDRRQKDKAKIPTALVTI